MKKAVIIGLAATLAATIPLLFLMTRGSESTPELALGPSSRHNPGDLTSSPIVFSLLILFAVLFVALLIICFIYLRRAMAARKGAKWAAIMATFGLRPRSSSGEPNLLQSVTGTFRGRNIQAAIRWEERNGILNVLVGLFGDYGTRSSLYTSPTRRVYYTYCRPFFDPPLLLGLRVESETRTGAVVHSLLKKPGVTLGSPAFDKAFRVQAIDPSQARNVLTSRLEGGYSIADLLGAARRARSKPSITDTFVNIELDGIVVDANRLEQALSMTVALAEALGSARLGAPRAAWERALADGWGRFAEAHGMAFSLERAEMSGHYAGQAVRVSLSIKDGVWHTRFTVPLGALPVSGLRVSPKGSFDNIAKLFGAKGVMGDPVFDQRFWVKGEPVGMVRQVLAPEVRQQLLVILSKTASLGIEGNELWISVNGMVTESLYLSAALDDATRTTQLLLWASGAPAA
jgi:hypothetical protein